MLFSATRGFPGLAKKHELSDRQTELFCKYFDEPRYYVRMLTRPEQKDIIVRLRGNEFLRKIRAYLKQTIYSIFPTDCLTFREYNMYSWRIRLLNRMNWIKPKNQLFVTVLEIRENCDCSMAPGDACKCPSDYY